MADSSSIPPATDLRLDAVRQEVEQRLSAQDQLKWTALDTVKTKQATSKAALAGWQIRLAPDYLGKARTLTLYVPASFPHDPPCAHVKPAAYQEWPHAESSGHLCLWRPGDAPAFDDPASLIEDFFDRVGRLLDLVGKDSDANRRQQEFQDEWIGYWIPANAKRAGLNNFLISSPPSEVTPLFHQSLIRVGTGRDDKGHIRTPGGVWRSITILADDPEEIKRWGADYIALNKLNEDATGLYIPLQRIVSPQMPVTVPELRAWVDACGGRTATSALDQALLGMQRQYQPLLLLFGLKAPNGVAVNGMRIEVKAQPYSGHIRRGKQQVLARPIWTMSPLCVTRADRRWMRDRGIDPTGEDLAKKHVVLVGCGMLGSPIADGLARTGVGHLTLIDPDDFDPANTGRHILGASYVGQPKALALAHHIKSNIPQIRATPICEDVVTQSRFDIFGEDVDLIICAAADWRCERFLISERAKRSANVPLQVCWLEPYSVAGHTLLSASPTDPLLTLFTAGGQFRKPCVDWVNGRPTYGLPACQATFQPAGMVAAWPSIAMCTSLALDSLLQQREGSTHAIWFSDERTAKSIGGALTHSALSLPENARSEHPLFS